MNVNADAIFTALPIIETVEFYSIILSVIKSNGPEFRICLGFIGCEIFIRIFIVRDTNIKGYLFGGCYYFGSVILVIFLTIYSDDDLIDNDENVITCLLFSLPEQYHFFHQIFHISSTISHHHHQKANFFFVNRFDFAIITKNLIYVHYLVGNLIVLYLEFWMAFIVFFTYFCYLLIRSCHLMLAC